jgi:hypothetical protein
MTQYYLRDVNGHALPFPILYEVIRCMVRDKDDSYVICKDRNRSFVDVDCHDITAEINKSLIAIMEQSPCARPILQRYTGIGGDDAAKLFFNVRICYQEETAKTASLPPSRVDSEAPTVRRPPGAKPRPSAAPTPGEAPTLEMGAGDHDSAAG